MSKESEDTKCEFMRQSNSVSSFIEERCELKPTAYVSKGDLYNEYKDYCDEENLQVYGKKQFSQTLGETPRVYSRKKQVKGRSQRCWLGIRPKSASEETEWGQSLDKEKRKVGDGSSGNQTVSRLKTPPSDPEVRVSCVECLKNFRSRIALIRHQA